MPFCAVWAVQGLCSRTVRGRQGTELLPLSPTPSHHQLDTRNEYDKVIQETESAYLKILESSQTLLTVLKREAVNIQKKRQASS